MDSCFADPGFRTVLWSRDLETLAQSWPLSPLAERVDRNEAERAEVADAVKLEPLPRDWRHVLGYAVYFSVLSAFHIGWRELNVGNWISRLQFRTYTLQATGWGRTVSGLQSLISVYLLALWALTISAGLSNRLVL